MTMTLEQVRDVLINEAEWYESRLGDYKTPDFRVMADAIDFHLSNPPEIPDSSAQPQPVAKVQPCELCFGRGERTADGSNGRRVRCATCNGTGQISRPVAQGEAVQGIHLPERMNLSNKATVRSHADAEGWNACIDKVIELNPTPTGRRVVPVEPAGEVAFDGMLKNAHAWMKLIEEELTAKQFAENGDMCWKYDLRKYVRLCVAQLASALTQPHHTGMTPQGSECGACAGMGKVRIYTGEWEKCGSCDGSGRDALAAAPDAGGV